MCDVRSAENKRLRTIYLAPRTNYYGGANLDSVQLENKKISELREMAKDLNIKGYSKYKKNELIDIIVKNSKPKEPEKEKQGERETGRKKEQG